MLKEIASYECDKGKAYLVKGMNSFFVLMGKCVRKGVYRCKTFSTKNYELALDKYKGYIEILNGRNPLYKCVFYSKSRSCKPNNCPKKLGGSDYWAIFREVCLFRTR